MSASLEELVGRLERVRKCGSGWTARCPAHLDGQPSLSVREESDGRVLVHCHAGCEPEDIVSALGLSMADLFPSEGAGERRPSSRRQAFAGESRQSAVPEEELERYRAGLRSDEVALRRLQELRGWTRDAVERLELGLDGKLVVFPVRDAEGRLVGLERYQPDPELRGDGPKLLAETGMARELFPPPETLERGEDWLLLLEGEPDCVAAFSAGFHAVAVPGARGWKAHWAVRFRGRRVCVIADCDGIGRKAASQWAEELAAVAEEVRSVDLDSGRKDGYDLTDFLAEKGAGELNALIAAAPLLVDARPQSAAAALRDVVGFFKRHLAVDEPIYALLAIWAAHTHAIDHFGTTPYLHITSAEPSSGKTRVLELLELVVREPMRASSLTTAVLFRAIDKLSPTLLLDEVDNLLADRLARAEIVGILNDGYRRGGRVFRIGGANRDELQPFGVFSPKAFAGLRELPVDALRSRCLRIEVKPRTQSEPGAGFVYEDEQPKGELLRQRLASHFALAGSSARPSRIDGVSDRTWEGVRPLVVLADQVGEEWPALVREAIRFVVAGAVDSVESSGVRLLADCRRVFDQAGKKELTKSDLLQGLTKLEDAPYGEWENFSTSRLTKTLKRYGIPGDGYVHDSSGRTHRGWTREHFREAWERWLPTEAPKKRATHADSLVEPFPGREEACDELSSHALAEASSPLGDSVRTRRTLSPRVAGDDGYRDYLNAAFAADGITERERHALRLHNTAVRRANASVGNVPAGLRQAIRGDKKR